MCIRDRVEAFPPPLTLRTPRPRPGVGHDGPMRRPDMYRRPSASQRAGIVAASASVPTSLVPSLRPRSAVDQGVITGLSSAMNYALTALAHDVVLGASHAALRLARARVDTRNTARTTLVVDVVAFAVASAVHAALPQCEDESITRALVRTGAHRIRAASLASALPGALDALPGRDTRLGVAVRSVPGMVGIGTGVSAAMQHLRVRRLRAAGIDPAPDHRAPTLKSLGVGAATAAGAVAFASVERRIAQVADRAIQRVSGAAGHGAMVSLALTELERTGALDRGLLVLCSPTGSGLVNYVAVSAWEYLTRGDCASLTLQYSLRPSVLSLDRVDEGREQNQVLMAALAPALAARAPERRPRVVLFGESLGAFTSQDTFLHTGTRGLRVHFVDRALWLGTPYASGWAREVRDLDRPDVEPGEVLRSAGADDLDQLEPGVAEAARYVLLSHQDDGVTLFSPELLVRCPPWLGDQRTPAVPPQAGWSTPVTFLQTLIDAKNSADTTPGRFTGNGHDHRGDLARAVRFAFDLKCTDDQLAAVEAVLRQEDLDRATAWPSAQAVAVVGGPEAVSYTHLTLPTNREV